ncbi:UNVERIFIED_CONTAM: transposase [Acetivibrio alkalicellulosi]
MLSWGFEKIFIACGSTDMRRGIYGLAAIVQECFELDPFSSSIFVFCNKKCDCIKMLMWDHNGFWLFTRRLEKGTFKWPQNSSSTINIDRRQLNWLLDGLCIEQKQAHKKVNSKAVI